MGTLGYKHLGLRIPLAVAAKNQRGGGGGSSAPTKGSDQGTQSLPVTLSLLSLEATEWLSQQLFLILQFLTRNILSQKQGQGSLLAEGADLQQ